MALSLEVEKAKAAKRAGLPEAEACAWITEVTGIAQDGDLGDWLHDGTVLCALANKLSPDSVKKIETSSSPFKQMGNVASFLRVAKQLGCPVPTGPQPAPIAKLSLCENTGGTRYAGSRKERGEALRDSRAFCESCDASFAHCAFLPKANSAALLKITAIHAAASGVI